MKIGLRVVRLLDRFRLSQNTERELQCAIADVFTSKKIPFEREAELSARDRPDFLLKHGVVLEVKTKGANTAVCRQLARYAGHEKVKLIILTTTRRVHVPPHEINEKPVLTVRVGSAFR